MLQKRDLAAIAEQIQSPYRPIPVATLGGMEVSLFICQGSRGWYRQIPRDQLMLVIEGVITVDSTQGKCIVSEGDMAWVPRDITHSTYSGMRSTVLLLEAQESDGRFNGQPASPLGPRGSIRRVSAAVEVRGLAPFQWLSGGNIGTYSAAATRVRGTSAMYVSPAGSLLVIVYRGMLDYRTPDEQGSLVGSQVLCVPSAVPITLESKHGATAVVVAQKGAPLPVQAEGGSAARGAAAPGADASED